MTERYKNMMESVELSGEARAAIEETIAAAPAPNRKMRPVRVAVIAACVCLALAGTVFAAELLPKLRVETHDTSPLDGSPAIGFSTVIEYDGDVIEEYPADGKMELKGDTKDNLVNEVYMPVRKLEPEAFSDELLALAAETTGFTRADFENFSDFEKFIGIELFSNPILDESRTASINRGETRDEIVQYKCAVEFSSLDGNLRWVGFDANYLANYTEMKEEEILARQKEIIEKLEKDPTADKTFATRDFVQVYMSVRMYTTNSPILPGEMFGTHLFLDGTTFSSETYTSPNGLEAVIISVYMPYGSVWHYAKLGINGAAVTLEVSHNDPSYALETLKDIIDAFEY